ncbi:MAG: SPASM domain-containing protein [Nanoarchaeota archaeon]|nr:SPASM domain-containing protein [Nanoarchaeota archaeon]MBU1270421.1 SPASM domain-containing protein [Nanoarchaeota archaeon]MBU2442463.1 SPASM domain-containing protein [Nanoarchaeota archaeon]
MGKDVDFRLLSFRTEEEFEFPNIINIEVYRGDCYCRCVHCPVGTTEPSERKERFGEIGIDLELYKKIVAEISQHTHSTVRIHSVGEPLMWGDLAEALKFTHDNDVRSWIFTCAVTNDTEQLEAICDNTDVVEVSVNSTTPEDYRATKGVNAFELVSENIRRMYDYIQDRNLTTRMLASRVESLDKAADQEFIRYWKSSGLVDDVFVRSYHTYNDIIPELSEGGQYKHEACLVHWGRFNISVDGYAIVCFNELFKLHLDPSVILGDLRDQSIAEIWHGPKLTALRRAELSRDYSALPFGDALPCKDCYSCQPLSGNRQTSEYQIRKLK